MADPLSIAGSVVGITAAGVQASVKLYALAEKVATASQRVTSIADDVSSTCAILNQVRELIIPQPDAQGTLRSVFNAVALNDISHALQRCRSVFTEIESLSRRAFEQVGKRPSLHSRIELSAVQKAKWPFLQPQFAELREDMREAKGNLVLMIAVASLALAQRDGRQRPIHENEKLELGSTIVALQRARISKSNNQTTSDSSQDRKWGLGRLFGKHRDMDSNDDTVPAGQIRDIFDRSTQEPVGDVPLAQRLDRDSAPPQKRARILSSSQDKFSVVDTSGASPYRNETNPAQQSLSIDGVNPLRDTVTPNPFMAVNVIQPSLLTLPSPVAFDRTRSSIMPMPEAMSDQGYSYHGWTTDHLQGLVTGRGDSIQFSQLVLPNQSLQKLVRTYTEEGQDPYVAMSELTAEQQNAIKGSFSLEFGEELVYVSLRNATVSSIFGTLNIERLRWIVASKATGQENYYPRVDTAPTVTSTPAQGRRRCLPGSRRPSNYNSLGSIAPSEYPTLPSISAMSEMSAAAPSSGLAPAFDTPSLVTPCSYRRLPAPPNEQQRQASQDGEETDNRHIRVRVTSSKSEYVVQPSLYAVETSEDDIVNELLARWTVS
ncbi:unnamed protein product [Alternaria alternata]